MVARWYVCACAFLKPLGCVHAEGVFMCAPSMLMCVGLGVWGSVRAAMKPRHEQDMRTSTRGLEHVPCGGTSVLRTIKRRTCVFGKGEGV